MKHEIRIPAAGRILSAELRIGERPAGVVVLVDGSGTSRHDSLNRFVAASLVRCSEPPARRARGRKSSGLIKINTGAQRSASM